MGRWWASTIPTNCGCAFRTSPATAIRRNALIADLLHRIEFIEKAGTGIRRIRDEVREQGCPETEFETNGFFTAIFRPNPDVRAQVGTHEAHVGAQSGPSQYKC
ncbi:MAG: ATP-binding protein [Verrucomicrobiota bacterium]